MSLPPFSPASTCAKCGHDDVTVRYIQKHDSWSTPYCGLTHPLKHEEHMDRRCQRCGYEWAEAVIEGADR